MADAMVRVPVSIVFALVLAGCAAPAVAPPPPAAPVVVPAPPPPAPAADWRDRPATPGGWSYTARPGGGSAAFGARGGGIVALLGCDRAARQVTLSLPAGTAAGPVTVRTTSTARTLPATAAPAGFALAATDPLLDAMAFSRGRFIVERAGAEALILPAQAEIGRVIEDCRG